MKHVDLMLKSKYFYNHIEHFVSIGIVEKISKTKYCFEGNMIEFKSGFVYVNDKEIDFSIQISERSYIEYLDDNNADFKPKSKKVFTSQLDYVEFSKVSYPNLLYKLIRI